MSELVPAGAVVYAEATLKPEGDQKQALDSILAKFPGGGQAGDKLQGLIEKSLRESDPSLSFKNDIEPWLGDEAAFFVSDFGAANGKPAATAFLVATDDEDAALKALEKTAEGKLTQRLQGRRLPEGRGRGRTPPRCSTDSSCSARSRGEGPIDASKDGAKLSDADHYKGAPTTCRR